MSQPDDDDPSTPLGKPYNCTFTPASRIKELNSIDHSIVQLLHAAGQAVEVVGSNSAAPDLSSAKSHFLELVTTYFTILSSIDVRLRRQVYALQEAGLIAEGDAKDAKRGASAGGAGGAGNGVGGQWEVNWSNGRGDQVELDMEWEVWRRAREFVDSLVREMKKKGGDENEEMNKHERAEG